MPMRLLLPLFLTLTAAAETFEVKHDGHAYTLTDEKTLELKSPRVNLVIEKQPCSQVYLDDLMKNFRSQLTPHLKKVTDPHGMVTVTTPKETVYVTDSEKNGKALRSFPDAFIKAYLVQKELCSKK